VLKDSSCTIAGLEFFLQDTDLKQCTDKKAAGQVFQKFLEFKNEFALNKSLHGCPKPCAAIIYDFDFFNIHRNSWIETKDEPELPNGVYLLVVVSDSLQVEEKVVTLVYDLENVFASLGGNLGLFLGFSCFSPIEYIIKYIRKLLKHY